MSERKLTCLRDDPRTGQGGPGGGDLVKIPIDIIEGIILVRLFQRHPPIIISKSVVGRRGRGRWLEGSWLLVTRKLGGFWGGRMQ